MSNATDEGVPRFAEGKHGIVVALDADFHAILAASGACEPSAIQNPDAGPACIRDRQAVPQVFAEFRGRPTASALITVKGGRSGHRLRIDGAECAEVTRTVIGPMVAATLNYPPDQRFGRIDTARLMPNGPGSGWSAIREVVTRAGGEDECPDAPVR